jgi:Fic family protein
MSTTKRYDKEFKIMLVELMLSGQKAETFSRLDYEIYFKNKISEKTARNDLSTLTEAGFIKQKGKGANTFYSKLKKQLPENSGKNDFI